MGKIYFDNGSTSFPKAPGVGRAMVELLERGAFNINRGGYEGAYELAGRVLDTREMLAKLFHAESSRQVIFTPGITWSLNMFLNGFLREGDHVVVSGMEHNGVMRPLEQLRKTKGISYDVARTSSEGEVTAEAVEEKIGPKTRLVLVLHASNVCGTVLPIEEIGEVCKRHDVFFAVDTAQSAGTLSVDMQKANIDFLGFTGHKGAKRPAGDRRLFDFAGAGCLCTAGDSWRYRKPFGSAFSAGRAAGQVRERNDESSGNHRAPCGSFLSGRNGNRCDPQEKGTADRPVSGWSQGDTGRSGDRKADDGAPDSSSFP